MLLSLEMTKVKPLGGTEVLKGGIYGPLISTLKKLIAFSLGGEIMTNLE